MAKRKAFTLIELLVVIAIIALLMAILMPALQRAKNQAKRAICCSNVKQIGVAMHTYAQSWDGKVLPYTNVNGQESSSPMPWTGVCVYATEFMDGERYKPMHLAILYEEGLIKNPEVFYCPAQPRTTNYPLKFHYSDYTEGGRPWGSYCPSAEGGGHTRVRTSYNYWTHGRSKLHELAQYPIVVDNLQEWEVIPHRVGDNPQGISALFGDGHVNFCIGEDLFDKDLWNPQAGVYNGPGNNTELFETLLRIVRISYQ